MPLKKRSRIRQPYSRTLDLPPSLRLVMLREVRDAFARACAKDYISKLKSEQGECRNIDENGELKIRRVAQPIVRRKLLPALKAPSWLDPKTGGPRL